MDWAAIGVAVVGIAFGAWQGIRALASDQRRQSKERERQRKRDQRRLRRAFQWGDLVDGHLHEQRRVRRRHDDDAHADGTGAIGVPAIPPEIEQGIRAYAEHDDEDEDGGDDV